MKKYTLNLDDYEIEFEVPNKAGDDTELRKENYPFRKNLVRWLRGNGVFKTGTEIVDAIMLAKQIQDCADSDIILNEGEVNILKKCLDFYIERELLGGPIHNDAICKVFQIEEIK